MNVFVEKKQRGFVCLLLVVTVVFLFLFSVSLGWLHPPFLSRDARVFFFFFSSSFCTTTFSLRFPCCLCFFFSSRVYFCFLSSSSPPRLRSSFFFSLALHVCRQPRRFLFFSVFFFFACSGCLSPFLMAQHGCVCVDVRLLAVQSCFMPAVALVVIRSFFLFCACRPGRCGDYPTLVLFTCRCFLPHFSAFATREAPRPFLLFRASFFLLVSLAFHTNAHV
jgi:hypothetical protein